MLSNVKSYRNQYFLGFVISIGSFSSGLNKGWSGIATPSIENLRPDLLPSPGYTSWVTSALVLGGLISGMLVCPLLFKFGRKGAMQLLALVWVISWVIMGLSINFSMLIMSRLLSGICGGATCIGMHIYVRECIHSEIQGILSSYFLLTWSLGTLTVYIMGLFLPWDCISFACAICPAILLLLLTLTVPESPVWLLANKKEEQALKVIKWLYKDHEKEMERYNFGKHTGTLEKVTVSHPVDAKDLRPVHVLKNHLKNLLSFLQQILPKMNMSLWKRFSKASLLTTSQQLVGGNIMLLYSYDILDAAYMNIEIELATVIIGAAQVSAIIFHITVTDRISRHLLLYACSALCLTGMFSLGIYLRVQNEAPVQWWGFMPLVFLCVYVFAFEVSFISTSQIVMDEMLPDEHKWLFSSLLLIVNSAVMLMIMLPYPYIEQYTYMEGLCWMFSLFSLVSAFVIRSCLPREEGETTKEIDSYFENRIGTAKLEDLTLAPVPVPEV